MKTTTAILVVFLAFANLAMAIPITLEAGVAYVDASGLRRYAAKRNLTQNQTSSVTAPQLRASVAIAPGWDVGLAYAYFGKFRGYGVAPSSDIFEQGGFALTVITPFQSEETIHESSFSVRYRWSASKRLAIHFGPEVSLFFSKAQIAHRSFSSTDLRLGGAAHVRYRITNRWDAGVGYRLAKPPDRTLHIYGVTVGYAL